MPKERFEPKKTGEYFVRYTDEDGKQKEDRIQFDSKNNRWEGQYPDKWYKERILSWWTVDDSPIK